VEGQARGGKREGTQGEGEEEGEGGMMIADLATWWPAGEGFAFSLAGSIIGGSLIAWLSGYYSEKGKRKLISEEFPKLLEQARQTAYEAEKGKNVATKEDLQQVVEQIRAVTREAEGIKAEISERTWHERRIWAERRDAYVEALNATHKLGRALTGIATSAENKLFDRATEYLRRAEDLTEQMYRSYHQLHIMGCAEYVQAFSDYTAAPEVKNVTYWPELMAWAYQRAQLVNQLTLQLSSAAKKELRTDLN
jgi:hypothetical protein